MSTDKVAPTIRLTLTEAQKAAVVRLVGREADTIDLRVEELEERIAPRLASNHNEFALG